VAKCFHHEGVQREYPWWLVVPQVTIELLAVEKALSDDRVGGLVTIDGIINVGKGPKKDEKERRQ
jgi:hypothetical protein